MFRGTYLGRYTIRKKFDTRHVHITVFFHLGRYILINLTNHLEIVWLLEELKKTALLARLSAYAIQWYSNPVKVRLKKFV